MGGLCLKNTFTRRCDRKEFDSISNEVTQLLKPYFKETAIPRFYYDKESFGDIDIVCNTGAGNHNDINNLIKRLFSSNEIYHNGHCYSFDYKEIQIDIILVSDIHFKSTVNYLSDNDLGNLIGSLAHQLRFKLDIYGDEVSCILKYGDLGFFIKIYYGDFKLGKFVITNDLQRIFKFLGLNYDKYKIGFNNTKEIFDFIIESKYFSRELFQLKNLTHINRERNKKRKPYSDFLDYIERFDGTERNSMYIYNGDELLNELSIEFPEINKIKLDLIKPINALKLKKSSNEKFNGDVIKEKYGLEGIKLGVVLMKFKQHISSENKYYEYIVNTDINEIFNNFERINNLKNV